MTVRVLQPEQTGQWSLLRLNAGALAYLVVKGAFAAYSVHAGARVLSELGFKHSGSSTC